MRAMTRRIAGLEPGGWGPEVAGAVVSLFDELAPEWHTRTSPGRTEIVRDALGRGLEPLLDANDLCVEVGSGIGSYSTLLEEHFAQVLSVELSWEMLVRAPAESQRVQGDGARLPVRDGSADAVVLINAFLFPDEVARVLSLGGAVVWVNSSGEHTPIHLTTAEVESALPFPVDGRESRAGTGTWCVLRRS